MNRTSALAVAALAAAPAFLALPASAAAPSLAPCSTAVLHVTLSGSEGAAGSTYTDVVFQNRGAVACTLDGHPGVSYVASPNGDQVGAAAQRTGTVAPVVLIPHAHAHATLRIVNPGNDDPATCQPVPASGFRVYPPDQTFAAYVPHPATACSNPAVRALTIGEVQPGV